MARSIAYEYAQVRGAIERDWTGPHLPVSLLDKQFLLLTDETLDDGVLMNETVKIENNGPVLENDLRTAPSRYDKSLDFQQLMQTRIMKCELDILGRVLFEIQFRHEG